MSRAGKKTGFIILKILGLGVLPLVIGSFIGFAAAYYLYTSLINNIDRECLSQVDIEYGHPITLDCFFTEVPPNTKFITNVDMIDTGMLATYDIAIDSGGHVLHSILNVVDRTAPVATAVPVKMYSGAAPEPKTLVKDVFDMTDVKCEYNDGEPDLSKGGKFNVGVRLTDTSGNYTVIDVPFSIVKDTQAPTIIGTHDIDVMVGSDSISYREGIVVTDDYCDDPVLEIDNSEVNLGIVGDYPLTFTASDDVGNKT